MNNLVARFFQKLAFVMPGGDTVRVQLHRWRGVQITQQLRLAYNAAYKAFHTIRAAILAHSTDGDVFLGGEVEVDESYFGGKRKGKRGRGAARL